MMIINPQTLKRNSGFIINIKIAVIMVQQESRNLNIKMIVFDKDGECFIVVYWNLIDSTRVLLHSLI